MSVIKVRIQKDFTVLYNGVLENTSLSFKAKGLWAYCMSRPDDWDFHVTHLATISKEKERSIYAALDELIAAGLVTREQKNLAKGERQGREGFQQVEYTIYAYPQEIKEMFAQRRFADAQVADAQNAALVSTDSHQELKREQITPAASVPPLRRKVVSEEKTEVSPRVWLTMTQREELFKKCLKDTAKVKACYQKLSDWKISKNMEGGNDYLTILNWVITAVETDISSPRSKPSPDISKSIVDQIKAKFPDHRDISYGYNYIEFNSGPMNCTHIKFTDGGFEEQVRNCLRKMELQL